MAKRDFYEVLQIDKGADEATIKRSYRKLVRELHPDANPDDPQAAEKFKEVKEAYDVLSDTEKKSMYDRYGMAAFENQSATSSGGGYSGGPGSGGFGGFGGFEGINVEDLFSTFMGGGSRVSSAQRRRMPQRGADLQMNLNLKFEESYTGVKKEVEITRNENCTTCGGDGAAPGTHPETCPSCKGSGVVQQMYRSMFGNTIRQSACPDCEGTGQIIRTPCRDCNGSGKVRKRRTVTVQIPAGVENNMRLRMSGEGNPGERGGPPGDLYVQLQVQDHELFKRAGNDLTLDLSVSIVQATLGADVEVPTLDESVTMRIPEGTETGTILRQRGKGFPSANGYGKGDFKVTVRVATPKNLSNAQMEAFLAFAATMGESGNNPQPRNVFDKMRGVFRGDGK